jgi:RNA recognition motif-containing protein
VKQFHPNVTKELLRELFIQVGPVRNVVHRPDHAFIEFQDSDSVAYALAAMANVHMYGQPLRLEPKLNDPSAFRFLQTLQMFEKNPELFGVVIQ